MDAELNPSSGDYTGERIAHLGNAVYLRLMTPRGSWWAEPELGSRLHELEREKDVPWVRGQAERYSRQALQALLDDGRARSVEVTADMPHNGRCLLHIEVTDATGRRQTFSHQTRVA